MSTDSAWEEWGRRDPYFGVITHPRFRRAGMTQEAKREFFESGQQHVDFVMLMIAHYFHPHFQPKTVVDFGCGVGRLVIPFARIAEQVIGIDVSPSMLAEAVRNCKALGIANASFVESDDSLSCLSGTHDLIHSFIVFQHIAPARGRELFRKLLTHLSPGGIAAMHFSYSKIQYAASHGIPPARDPSCSDEAPAPREAALAADTDPEIQMNPYNVNELLFVMQEAGIRRFHVEFTDHGGELGVFVFFQKP